MKLRLIFLFVALMLLFIGQASATSSTCGTVSAEYNATTGIINTWGTQTCISGINATINNASLLNETSPKIWVLNAILYANSTTTMLYLNNTDAVEIRITDGHYIRYKSKLDVNYTKVISWNESTSDVSYNVNRAFFLINESGAWYTNVRNSNFSYLGSSTSTATAGATFWYVQNLTNNTFVGNYQGVRIGTSKDLNTNVSGNTIINSTGYGIFTTAVTGITVHDNKIIGRNKYTVFDYGLYLGINTNSSNFHDNEITDFMQGITQYRESLNNIIDNNKVSLFDKGIVIDGLYSDPYLNLNTTIINNNFLNGTRNTDGSNTCIVVAKNIGGINTSNNTCRAGHVGIVVSGSPKDNIIANNDIDLIDIDEKPNTYMGITSLGLADWLSPPAAIEINPIFFGFRMSDNYLTCGRNYSAWNSTEQNWSQGQPTNTSISGNVFGNNVSIYMIDMGSNTTHDLTNYKLYNWSLDSNSGVLFPHQAVYVKSSETDVYGYGNELTKTTWSGRAKRDTFQFAYSWYVPVQGWNTWANYGFNNSKFNIKASGIELNPTSPFTTKYFNTNFTQIYVKLYSPQNIFGVNINNTIYSNGTTQITLTNDSDMPNWYSTINMSIIPSDSVNIIVNTDNSTMINFTATGSGTLNITVNNSDFVVTDAGTYRIKKDGAIQQTTIAASNNITFSNISLSDGNYVIEQVAASPSSPLSTYVTSTCQSVLGWGEVGSALIIVLILAMVGGLALVFISGKISLDTFPIQEFVLTLVAVVVIGSIGVAIINPIIVVVGCP